MTDAAMIAELEAMAAASSSAMNWTSLKQRILQHNSILRQMGTSITESSGGADSMGASRGGGGPETTILLEYISSINGRPDQAVYCLYLLHVQERCLPLHDSCRQSYGQQMLVFLTMCNVEGDAQAMEYMRQVIQFCHNEFSPLMATLPNVLRDEHLVKFILPLERALHLSCPGEKDTVLTAAHATFVQICAMSRMYSHAVEHLTKHPVLEIDPPLALIVPEQYLSYHYYAALCFIAMKSYPLALEHLSNCITIPSNACSAITLLAHRTAMLVSLLHTGTRFAVPQFASSIVKTSISHSTTIKSYRYVCHVGISPTDYIILDIYSCYVMPCRAIYRAMYRRHTYSHIYLD